MKRRNVIILALSGLAALTGAECADTPGGNEPAKPKTDTGGAPPAFEADSKKEWTGIRVAAISAWVEPQYGSYRVTASATDLTTGENINLIDAPKELGILMKPGQQFTHLLAYPEHDRVELNVHVKADKPGSQHGYIAVRLPSRRAGRKTETMNGQAAASLYTVIG
jgi:hypothetical protein